jgi:hypothetical protein
MVCSVQAQLVSTVQREAHSSGADLQGEQARQSYLQSLGIRQRLAQAEPDRASDYQRESCAHTSEKAG